MLTINLFLVIIRVAVRLDIKFRFKFLNRKGTIIMVDIILKTDAINLIKEVVGNNQGCTELFLYDKYKEKGGTYRIHGRNDSTSLTFEEVLKSMVDLKMILRVEDENGTKLYYLTNFIEKDVTVSVPYIPNKCKDCRFVAETANCKMAHVKSKHCCLLDLLLEIDDESYEGSKKNLYCPLNE